VPQALIFTLGLPGLCVQFSPKHVPPWFAVPFQASFFFSILVDDFRIFSRGFFSFRLLGFFFWRSPAPSFERIPVFAFSGSAFLPHPLTRFRRLHLPIRS